MANEPLKCTSVVQRSARFQRSPQPTISVHGKLPTRPPCCETLRTENGCKSRLPGHHRLRCERACRRTRWAIRRTNHLSFTVAVNIGGSVKAHTKRRSAEPRLLGTKTVDTGRGPVSVFKTGASKPRTPSESFLNVIVHGHDDRRKDDALRTLDRDDSLHTMLDIDVWRVVHQRPLPPEVRHAVPPRRNATAFLTA